MKKLSLAQIYSRLHLLESQYNWTSNTFYDSRKNPNANGKTFPAMSFSSPTKGPAAWIISGIHGEEPAGPNAIARNIEFLGELGAKIPIVLFPLCNPLGYSKSWRYPYQRKWGINLPNISAGDSEHYLPDLNNPKRPRTNKPSCQESQKLIGEILRLSKTYPISVCFDLHEDNMIDQGYIYAYGTDEGLKQYLSKQLLSALNANQVRIKKRGKTRFNEPIKNGVIPGIQDGSIEELLSSSYLIINSKRTKGPGGEACFVVETPAAALPLEKRVAAHSAILKLLERL